MSASHQYELVVEWTGNRGIGTSDYRAYGREHDVRAEGNATTISGSADPAFRGDPERWNPEELLVASLSQCHMLWFLHLAAVAGVVVTEYVDSPVGTLEMDKKGGGSGQFTEVILRPSVTVADGSMIEKVAGAHEKAAEKCFIARSVNFPVKHEPSTRPAP
ncbi:OsmC family protein [Phytoactinopolyspora mesophila]|uniref:OsmC family peroxiredoxin n=1 Tax=Phytoactinopolyspora mesophila TaxID=2650750 RepID=A0A7K3MD34_9ACTN|nr:OsmC family protein [Phytoactinopolyspora mesophila]NDL60318.1 OsmC family peroxiredoxin [Phytoactinopolyspora mesophila]